MHQFDPFFLFFAETNLIHLITWGTWLQLRAFDLYIALGLMRSLTWSTKSTDNSSPALAQYLQSH